MKTTHSIIAFALAICLGLTPQVAATPAVPTEATTKDSDARQWSGIDGTRYGDSIRRTSRVTYTDAGVPLQASCNLAGDIRNDLVFVDIARGKMHIVDHIPYGSDSDDVTLPIGAQDGVVSVDLPAGTTGVASCIKVERGAPAKIAVASGKNVFIGDSTGFPSTPTYTFDDDVTAIAPVTAGVDVPGMVVAAGGSVHYFAQVDGTAATTVWTGAGAVGTLAPIGYTAGDSPTIGVGAPSSATAYALPLDAPAGPIGSGATTITGGTSFGTSLVGIGDVNGDDLDDYAVGAPLANDHTGAVAIVYGTSSAGGRIAVDTASVGPTPVVRDGTPAGTLIRQVGRGRIGTTLAYIPQYDPDNRGALVIGRPDHEEHPGAVIVSETELNQNWNTGGGLDSVPSSSSVFLASEEGGVGDGGYNVGVVAPFDSDTDLTAVYTADTKGKIDVWTVDMRRQHETTPPASPLYPAPPAPSASAAYTPVDEVAAKSWLGTFTGGLGGALAKGSCDVTGDGIADIISGNAIRSEYKFDPFYEDSTPTHGWVFNVTGAVQIIPGGTPGGVIGEGAADSGREDPSRDGKGVITLVGPRTTADPSTDSAVGFSVACLGDVNGDGVSDIAASSVTTGKVWVIYGGAALASTSLEDLSPARGYVITLPPDGAGGYQVTRVGDVDGDGLADVGFVVSNAALAMQDLSKTYGSAFIVRGNATGQAVTMTSLESPAVLLRINSPLGHTFNAFTPVGDVNGDGHGDYVVTDFNSFTPKGTVPGAAWVIYGGSGGLVDLGGAYPGYALTVDDSASFRLGAGNSIARGGDVNGDGIGDFVIGFDGGTIMNQTEGGVALVLGTTDASVTERHIDPTGATTDDHVRIVTGAQKESGFGWAVDTTPTGLLAIGASGEGANGAVHVLRLADIPAGATPISALGDRVTTIDSKGERSRFGRTVAFVGNVLGEPTLAFGGDGVIDNPATEEEGYAHSAHILAVTAQSVTPAAPATGSGDSAGSSSPAEIGGIVGGIVGAIALALGIAGLIQQFFPEQLKQFLAGLR
ncbi:hypothetical protein J7S19_10960 [Corynebacterium pyruviciproducens]|uniref:hypothetical protein n=1 Tax=Corynebacterium pyruviciproducens TaxID=598660 RepID=UPI002456040B|nr:hypothetical protein [Corynebacterium pyruviciproducens]MDH4659109.1 hypothetical protein [Corynebacterium pyruviciproducens]